MSNLIYSQEINKYKIPDTYLVEIPSGISSKQDLLKIYAELLKFPDYFGFNWDALEDLLMDLSWLHEKKVVVFHNDLPSLSNEDIQLYLSILDNASSEGSILTNEEATQKLGYIPKQSVKFVFSENLKNEVEYLVPTEKELQEFLLTKTLPKKLENTNLN